MKKFKNIAVFCIQQIMLTCDNRIAKLKGVVETGAQSAYNAGTISGSRKNSIVNEVAQKVETYKSVKKGTKTLGSISEQNADYKAKTGEKNSTVTEIQERLFEIGFTSQLVTGYYGDITFNNVAYFQIINDLIVTGWVDEETYTQLTKCEEEQEVQEIESPEPPIAIITNISTEGYGKNQVVTFEAYGNETTEEIFIGLYNGDNFADYATIQAQNGKYEVKITEEGTYTIFTIARSKEGIQTKGFEMKFEVTDKSNPITTSMYFLMGVGEELWSTVKGTAEFLMDIPGGVQAIGEGIRFFWRARTPGTEESDQFQEMVVAIWEEAKNGTDNEQARLLGKATVQVVLTFIAIKGVAKSVDTLVTMARNGTLGTTIVNGIKKPIETAKAIATKTKLTVSEAITSLKNTGNFKSTALEHIFSGKDGGGYHYEGLEGAAGKVTQITKTPNKFGVYEAQINVAGKVKKSTFFPKSWTPQQVVDAINSVYDDIIRALNSGDASTHYYQRNEYYGYYKGLRIHMYLDRQNNNQIISAFPIYQE